MNLSLSEYSEGCYKDEIIKAIEEGDYNTVLACIISGINVNSPLDSEGTTRLMIAVSENQTEIVIQLIKNGANIESEDVKGRTALNFNHKNYAIVEALLKAGANPNHRDDYKWGSTPLHLAALRGDKKMIRKLLEFGADINAKDYNGNMALHNAADWGKLEAVIELINKGSELDSKNCKGNSAYMLALYRAGKINEYGQGLRVDSPEIEQLDKIAKYLKKRGAKLTLERRLALSSKNNDINSVKELIMKGAKSNESYWAKQSTLKWAEINNNKEIAKLLLMAGAEYDYKGLEHDNMLIDAWVKEKDEKQKER